MSEIVCSETFGMQDHKNEVFELGILLVSGLQAKIYVLPVLAVAILDIQTFGYISGI